MRNKLIELLETKLECNKDGHGECEMCEYLYSDDACIRHISEITADFMISNNVVVLPVKPRDTVYTISRGKIKEWTVYYVGMNTLGHIMFNYHDKDLQNTRAACEVDLGETVFLTEEDAINELKERRADDPS
jgi:hypothetical protein